MDDVVQRLKEMRLPLKELVDVVVADETYQTNKVFDYLMRLNISEIIIYRLVSTCFLFQTEYVVKKLLAFNFPPSLIVIFIKRTKLGLSDLMLEFLEKNRPSGADMTYLLYDSPDFLTPQTFDLLTRRVTSIFEVMTILDNAKGLSQDQRYQLINLCTVLASEESTLNLIT